MRIPVVIVPPPITEWVEIPDGITRATEQIAYAHDVATERFADLLRDGDAYHKFYTGATYEVCFERKD